MKESNLHFIFYNFIFHSSKLRHKIIHTKFINHTNLNIPALSVAVLVNVSKLFVYFVCVNILNSDKKTQKIVHEHTVSC